MAKRKTNNKELKIKAPTKKEALKIPDTKMVDIFLYKDAKIYKVGNALAHTLIGQKRAKLA